jgi:Protein of unknown function (DUF3237)
VAELRSEFLLQLRAEFDEEQVLGDTPLGTRRILYMKGGSFSGPRLQGRILPGGGDWVLLRRDGVAQLDIRLTLRTDDDELIYVSCDGVFDITPETRRRIMQGANVDPAEYYFRTALGFETGAQRYVWLNRLLAIGIGARTAKGMVTDVFAVR